MGEKVTVAPEPVNGGKALLSVASRHGNAEMPFKDDIGADSLAIQVNCQGRGTIKVFIEPVGIYFPLECVAGEVSSAYNELRLKRDRAEGSVRVSAPSGVQWALTLEQ